MYHMIKGSHALACVIGTVHTCSVLIKGDIFICGGGSNVLLEGVPKSKLPED